MSFNKLPKDQLADYLKLKSPFLHQEADNFSKLWHYLIDIKYTEKALLENQDTNTGFTARSWRVYKKTHDGTVMLFDSIVKVMTVEQQLMTHLGLDWKGSFQAIVLPDLTDTEVHVEFLLEKIGFYFDVLSTKIDAYRSSVENGLRNIPTAGMVASLHARENQKVIALQEYLLHVAAIVHRLKSYVKYENDEVSGDVTEEPIKDSQINWPTRNDNEALLKINDVATMTGISHSKIYKMFHEDSPLYDPTMPKPMRLDTHHTRPFAWHREAIAGWIEKQVTNNH